MTDTIYQVVYYAQSIEGGTELGDAYRYEEDADYAANHMTDAEDDNMSFGVVEEVNLNE